MPAPRFAPNWMIEVDNLYRNVRHLDTEQLRDGYITSYNPQTGEIVGVTSTGTFVGQMPEIASGGGRIAIGYSPQGCMVMRNKNQSQPTVIATNTPDLSDQLLRYRAGAGFFRPLEAGAVELRSAGMAGVFADNYGTLELRGGVAMGTISHERMAIEWRAPTHRRLMHTNNDYFGGDMEAFGTVVRHLNPLDPLPQPLPEPTNPTSFAKEYVRTLSGTLATATNVREGTVLLDDLGIPLLSGKGVPLRAIHEYGGLVPGASSSWKVDQIGNMEFTTGLTAVNGVAFSSLTGTFSVLAGLGVSLTSPLDVGLKGSLVSINALADFNLKSLATATLWSGAALNLTSLANINVSAAAILNLLAPTINLGSPPGAGVGLVTELTYCPYTMAPHGAAGVGTCTKLVRVNPL